jgi:replicative DNA helicase
MKAGIIQQKIVECGNIARELKTHICLVAQLRRMGKDREKVDPREMLKESGGFEERADLLFMVSRPAYYKKEEIEDNCIHIRILKQRDGPDRTLELGFSSETLLITDRVQEENQEDGLGMFGGGTRE